MIENWGLDPEISFEKIIRIADPKNFNAYPDPDPAFHFKADPDPAPHQSQSNLLNFDFNADPELDPTFRFNASSS